MSEYNPIVINWTGLSFLIVNLGVPWALRPNSPVLLRSCPKRVLFLFFRRELSNLVLSECFCYQLCLSSSVFRYDCIIANFAKGFLQSEG